MAQKTKHQYGEKIICPHCGLPGRFLREWGDGSMDVEHESGVRTFTSAVTGLPVPVQAFLDGCTKHGKIGSKFLNRTPRIFSLDKVVEDEF